MNLPKWYNKWIARVSNIVSYKFPFDWIAEANFNKVLDANNIKKKDYMDTANWWWTYLHKIAEDYILNKPLDLSLINLHWKEIEGIKKYVDNLKKEFPTAEWLPEVVCHDKLKRFQWTADLVRRNWNKIFIYDWKSFEIVKKAFPSMKQMTYKKDGSPFAPTDKLKKVSLQLSLYAQTFIQQGFDIGGIYLCWVTENWVFEYKADLWEQEDIDKLVTEYLLFITPNMTQEVEIDIKAPLLIRIQTSPVAYSSVAVELDLWKLDNWQTAKEAINELVKVQKTLHSSYLPKEN